MSHASAGNGLSNEQFNQLVQVLLADDDAHESGPPSANGANGRRPSANGKSGAAAPSANGANGAAVPSANGVNGAAPSANGKSGRDARGRFAPGNPGGPGNPFARQVAAFRTALCTTLKPDDFRDLAVLLAMMGKNGNLAALRLLFSYTIGRPTDPVNPDTLDAEEWRQYQQAAASPEAFAAVVQGVPADLACDLIRALLPLVAGEKRRQLTEVIPLLPPGEGR